MEGIYSQRNHDEKRRARVGRKEPSPSDSRDCSDGDVEGLQTELFLANKVKSEVLPSGRRVTVVLGGASV